MNNINKAEQLYKEHFNKEPLIIGLFWEEPRKVYNNLLKAIETNKPYNEYDLLTDEEKKAFDDGELLF
jgi:hypothetical protein